MKRFLSYLVIVLATLLPAAHFLRLYGPGPAAGWLALLPLLCTGRAWVRRVYQLALLGGFVTYLEASASMVRFRMSGGLPWGRLAVIMAVATLVVGCGVLVLEGETFRRRFRGGERWEWPPFLAAVLVFGSLVPVQLMLRPPMLILERFQAGAGWLEAGLIALYAARVTELMLDPERSATVRRRVWLLFSMVFFGQLGLGLVGFETFLMTGKLHLPVPALILAGPVYRGAGYFMLILFAVTFVLVGPAWCSHLCYIGAWDNGMCMSRRRSGTLPAWRHPARLAILGLVLTTAVLLRWLEAPVMVAVWLGAAFGLVGVAVMVLVSRKLGSMAHCAAFCPMGTVAQYLGRISPWQMRIADKCTRCGHCTAACRYGALEAEDIVRRRPGVNCTLCGDCVGACPRMEIGYRFLGRRSAAVRTVFVVLVVSLHALFLAVARI